MGPERGGGGLSEGRTEPETAIPGRELATYDETLVAAKSTLNASPPPSARQAYRALSSLLYVEVPMLQFLQEYQSPILFGLMDDVGEYAACRESLPEIAQHNVGSVEALRTLLPRRARTTVDSLAQAVQEFNRNLDEYLHFRDTHTKERDDGRDYWDVDDLKASMRAIYPTQRSIEQALEGLSRLVAGS